MLLQLYLYYPQGFCNRVFSLDKCRKSRMPSLVAKASSLPLQLSIGTVACRQHLYSSFIYLSLPKSPRQFVFAGFCPLYSPLRTNIKNVGLYFSYWFLEVLDYLILQISKAHEINRERLQPTFFGELREIVQISRNQNLSKNALLCHINTY